MNNHQSALMTPDEFRALWNSEDESIPLVQFTAVALDGVEFPQSSKNFLLVAGLPDSAAPCLNFEVPKQGALPKISALYRQPEDLSRYRLIGGDGSGDPICIDEMADGVIVALNHDGGFRRVVVNSTVEQLAEFLLVYRTIASLAVYIRDEDVMRVRIEFVRIDPAAMRDGYFWDLELSALYELEN